nr:malto-oligosyltrehalose trehalohydrolase [uncultured Pseudomonas sp.]
MPPVEFKHGARLEPDRSTRFALWAPDAEQVAVVLSDGLPQPLLAEDDGWFSVHIDCPPGTRYRFLIDQHLLVPDPASRAQIEGVLGPSRVTDQQAYRWRVPHWRGRPWHEAVIYELHVGLFGGFAAVEAFLPRLVELGISAIELMPLGEFPGRRNWGYDGVLPFAPSSAYGTPDELKQLIDKAHSLGLMVFVDVVYNHFGPEGNYLGEYASGFFREDVHTPWGPAIDFRRQPVRDFFIENALMWVLDYRIDGLRLDAVHAISEQDFLLELADRVHAAVSINRHVHLILENEDNSANLLDQGFVAQWNDDGHNVLHVLLTGERQGYYADFAQAPTQKLLRCLAEGFVFQGQIDRRGEPRGQLSTHLPSTAFVLFLQNHDQVGNRAFGERLIELVDEDTLKTAIALLLLCPMVPLLFMGEDWGAKQPFLYFTDYREPLASAVREGRRNEFRDFREFADPQRREEIPDPNALSSFSASQVALNPELQPAQQAWRDYYRELIELRRQHLTPHLSDVHSERVSLFAEGALAAVWRLDDNSLLRIDLNLSQVPVQGEAISPEARLLFSRGLDPDTYRQGNLAARSIVVSLESQP